MPIIDKERWHRISPLLDELLDAPVAVRQARLATLAQQDPPLARDLGLLLMHSLWVAHTGFLEGTAMDGLSQARRLRS